MLLTKNSKILTLFNLLLTSLLYFYSVFSSSFLYLFAEMAHLPEIAQKIITDQRQMLRQNSIISPWLFPDRQGNMINPRYIYKSWIRFRTKNQITACSLYELRHTMVSITKNGVPTHLLKMVLGHTEAMDTYGVYGHEFAGDFQNVANATQNMFNQILGN